MEPKHKRRVRYKGTHPKKYNEKYKELNPDLYPETIEKVIKKGSTPVGMHLSLIHICKPENQIIISTRHSSKGLEFEVVVMMGMEDDHFPGYYDKKESKSLEECNRLCFVCVSRAKSICILMRSRYYTIPTKNGPWKKIYNPSIYWQKLYSIYGNSN